ncbi:MAG TPA: hypothetical protein VKM54_13580 [Myxococcota bacterium]|nr:hypothetical protein [Myxococcota bacterium]
MKATLRCFAVACTVASLVAPMGCASDSRRVTREETVRTTSSDTASAENEGEDHGHVVETRTTVTDEEKNDQGGGVIITTVGSLGEVIAFPFRLGGAVSRAIF